MSNKNDVRQKLYHGMSLCKPSNQKVPNCICAIIKTEISKIPFSHAWMSENNLHQFDYVTPPPFKTATPISHRI